MKLTKNERRTQILEIATQIFVEKGYHDTRTKSIAEACGVTEPVIYKHFSSKEELFLEVISSIAGETFNEIIFDKNTDTGRVISSFVLNRAGKVEKTFSLFKRLLSELLENEKIRRYYYDKYLPRLAYPLIGYLDQLKEQDLIKKDIPSKVIVLGLVGILIMVSLAKNLEEKSAYSEYTTDELASQLLHIYLHGLLNQKS